MTTHQANHQATRPAAEDRGAVLAAWTGFLFGTAISVGGNVLATWLPKLSGRITDPAWTPGIWPQVGAAVWPLALLLSVEVLTRTNWRAGLQWAVARLCGIVAVALGGAVISYGHLHEVLTAWHYPYAAAVVGPLVIDGLMLISGFALLSISKNRATANTTTTGTAGSTGSTAAEPDSAIDASEPTATSTDAGTGTGTSAVTAKPSETGTGTSSPTTSARAANRHPSRASTNARRTRTGGGNGSANQVKARTYWDAERAAGREPSGADLARVAGVDPSQGRRWRRDWLTEPHSADQDTRQDPAQDLAQDSRHGDGERGEGTAHSRPLAPTGSSTGGRTGSGTPAAGQVAGRTGDDTGTGSTGNAGNTGSIEGRAA